MSWKRLTSRMVYENPWISVHDERVVNPGGGENDYGRVHFKSKAIAIVPLDDNGNTWIVGQDRYTIGEYSWEVPMGGSDAGEDPLDTAHRELREETGLTAGRMQRLMRLHTSNSITDEEGFAFLATDLRAGEPEFDEMEVLEIRKLPLTDVVQMIMAGEMTDAMSIAAILRVYLDDRISRADTT